MNTTNSSSTEMECSEVDIPGLRSQMVCQSCGALWIFGYGSLIWKPGFTYQKRVIGHLNGYKRRFFQGTTTHRGTAEWPGRVATIEAAPQSEQVWGVAYQVQGLEAIDSALKHLAEREMITGGYHFERVLFTSASGETFYIQVYVADAINNQYLGDAPIKMQAYQIWRAHGVCGANIEYVQKVVDFMEQEVPDGLAKDSYLNELITDVRRLQKGSLTLSADELAQLPVLVRCVERDEEFALAKSRESAANGKLSVPEMRHACRGAGSPCFMSSALDGNNGDLATSALQTSSASST